MWVTLHCVPLGKRTTRDEESLRRMSNNHSLCKVIWSVAPKSIIQKEDILVEWEELPAILAWLATTVETTGAGTFPILLSFSPPLCVYCRNWLNCRIRYGMAENRAALLEEEPSCSGWSWILATTFAAARHQHRQSDSQQHWMHWSFSSYFQVNRVFFNMCQPDALYDHSMCIPNHIYRFDYKYLERHENVKRHVNLRNQHS